MQSVQVREAETNLAAAAQSDPVAVLAADLEAIRSEIRALYKAPLSAAAIHQIVRGAQEQSAIARMMLDDCVIRAANGSLNEKHLANARRWLAGIRRFMENRQAAYTTGVRRKFYVIKTPRTQ